MIVIQAFHIPVPGLFLPLFVSVNFASPASFKLHEKRVHFHLFVFSIESTI